MVGNNSINLPFILVLNQDDDLLSSIAKCAEDAKLSGAHAVLADSKFRGIAGHVDNAKVGLTVEVTIVPLPGTLQRAVDPETGFGPIIR